MNLTVADIDRQDIRVAVVMNGGVSLAIWISGVTLELHHLAEARKDVQPEYRRMLDELLKANVRVDVIAGTSAGGLNGAFLALALAGRRDLTRMRDLWRELGDLRHLLRHPLDKNPPSLLRGDDYFLTKITEALTEVHDSGPNGTTATGNPPSPVELILTGTLWDGRLSTFTDDMGTNITEQDHDATFRFASDGRGDTTSGDLGSKAVIDQLARAARCTCSFPGAFEPHLISVGKPDDVGDGRWPSSAGRANFSNSQYVVDGGVLLNKPLRPALEAIYRQPAVRQVRRVLAYVFPSPNEQSADTVIGQTREKETPNAREVVLDVFTRLRSTDSVSRELAEIRDRNEFVRSRRRARDRLAGAMTRKAGDLAGAAWDGYREVRFEYAAAAIADLIFAGQADTDRKWSRRELVDAIRRRPNLSFVPQSESLSDELSRLRRPVPEWGWGPTAVQRLGDMSLDVLKRAVWLAPLTTSGPCLRDEVVSCLRTLHEDVLSEIRADRRALDGYWSAAARGAEEDVQAIPERRGPADLPTQKRDRDELDRWLAEVIPRWESVTRPPSTTPIAARLYGDGLAVASKLYECAGAIEGLCDSPNPRLDRGGDETSRLRDLYEYLLAGAADAEEVLDRLLRLDVVQLAFGGATSEVEQQVELVQVSSRHPGYLTGRQAHHFGAFYRPSWRMNDWLHGRMDGAHHIVRILLSPERLRQLGTLHGEMLDVIEAIAVPEAGDRDHEFLAGEWRRKRDECEMELKATADENEPLPKSLPSCVDRITGRIQTRILREDLGGLADAIGDETDPPVRSRTWLSSYRTKTHQGRHSLSTRELWDFWDAAKQEIGRQRIKDEIGGDTLAQTTTHTVAVASNVVGTGSRIKMVGGLLHAFRGYALIVWAMVLFLTTKGNLAKRIVDVAIAVGGTLVATAILVPNVPLGLILAGVLLILAGATSAAILAPDRGARVVGFRLLIGTVVAGAAIFLYSWRTWHHPGSQDWEPFAKFGIAVLIILLGLFVAKARKPGGFRRWWRH
jgi:patatin-related protein